MSTSGSQTSPRGVAPDEAVLAFLLDIRSGRRLERAEAHLAPIVRAHQGAPHRAREWVDRTPAEYVAHVRDMLAAAGPWQFEVVSVVCSSDPPGSIEARWLQTSTRGAGCGLTDEVTVEHGRAWYVVHGGKIVEYWIAARTHTGECLPSSGACHR